MLWAADCARECVQCVQGLKSSDFYQVHKYVSTGLANSKFGIRNSKLQVRALSCSLLLQYQYFVLGVRLDTILSCALPGIAAKASWDAVCHC